MQDEGSVRLRSYGAAVRHGVGFVPEERRTQGIMLRLPVGEQLLMPQLSRGFPLGYVRPSAIERDVEVWMSRFLIRAPSQQALVGQLSGGNQQKVSVAKWLTVAPRLLLLDEPTRGVDVGAKAEIHRLLRGCADDGMAIVFVSSDLPELLALADTIKVMRDGSVEGEFTQEAATEERVIALAAGQGRTVGRDG